MSGIWPKLSDGTKEPLELPQLRGFPFYHGLSFGNGEQTVESVLERVRSLPKSAEPKKLSCGALSRQFLRRDMDCLKLDALTIRRNFLLV